MNNNEFTELRMKLLAQRIENYARTLQGGEGILDHRRIELEKSLAEQELQELRAANVPTGPGQTPQFRPRAKDQSKATHECRELCATCARLRQTSRELQVQCDELTSRCQRIAARSRAVQTLGDAARSAWPVRGRASAPVHAPESAN